MDDDYNSDEGLEEGQIPAMYAKQDKANSTNKKKKKKKKSKKTGSETKDLQNTLNGANEEKPPEEPAKKKNRDPEIEEFERRLTIHLDPTKEKIKLNISEEWIQSLRQKIHRLKNRPV
jgi:hypothetical protein